MASRWILVESDALRSEHHGVDRDGCCSNSTLEEPKVIKLVAMDAPRIWLNLGKLAGSFLNGILEGTARHELGSGPASQTKPDGSEYEASKSVKMPDGVAGAVMSGVGLT